MLATKSRESAKTKAEGKSGSKQPKIEAAEKAQINPLWTQLATRVQAKLTVGASDDPLEREADRVADQVMRMPDLSSSNRQLSISSIGASTAQRKCSSCEEEEEKLQRKESGSSGDFPASAPTIVHESLSSSGQPLDANSRSFFEMRLGTDLNPVRVHTDDKANMAAQAINARAFTFGRDVVFGQGQYQPQSDDGRRLLAHELTHVVQQTKGVGPPIVRRDDRSPAEIPDAGANDISGVPLPQPPSPQPATPQSVPTSPGTSDELKGVWEEGNEILKLGIVATEEGVNLRPTPETTSAPITKLAINTRMLVNRERAGGWYHVVLNDGRDGFVAKSNVSIDLPDAGSRLYRIQGGESALDLVKKFYKADAATWGQDERFFVNVLVFANQQRGRLGIYKENPDDAWDMTKTKADSQIWIPSVDFAKTLKGKVSSGSLSYEVYQTVADAAYAVGEFLVGGIAFVAGLLHGALESVWDTLVGLVDLVGMVWKILKSLFTGNLLADTQALFSDISKISLSELAKAGLDWLDKKWNDPSLLKRWHFRGWIIGYAIAEIAMLFFSEGILTAIKGVAKVGKFSEIIAKLPKVAKFVEEIKATTKGLKELEALKAVAKTLAAAREWVIKVLKVPAKILGDLTLEAIERLKKLPAWARERFAELADAVKIRLLGCASPCKVDLEAIQKYLAELAAKGATGAKKLTLPEHVLAALPTDLNIGKIKKYLEEYPALMEVIKKAELTDKDFGKLADFLTGADKTNPQTAYQTFTRYLTQVVPSKTGPDIDTFNKIVEAMVTVDARQGAALKGPMFEAFVRLHIPEFAGKAFERATFKLAGGGTRTADRFFAELGEIWEIKHQLTDKVPASQLADYLALIGQKTASGAEVKSINYIFATEEAAKLNAHLKPLGARVFFLKPPGVLTTL